MEDTDLVAVAKAFIMVAWDGQPTGVNQNVFVYVSA